MNRSAVLFYTFSSWLMHRFIVLNVENSVTCRPSTDLKSTTSAVNSNAFCGRHREANVHKQISPPRILLSMDAGRTSGTAPTPVRAISAGSKCAGLLKGRASEQQTSIVCSGFDHDQSGRIFGIFHVPHFIIISLRVLLSPESL